MRLHSVIKPLLSAGLLCCLLSCKGDKTTGPADSTVTYQITNEIFPNPERGFVHTMNVFSGGAGLNSTQLGTLRAAQNVSMIIRIYYFDAFKDKPVSDAELALIQADLDKVRAAGLKMVFRFAYTDSMTGTDAPLSIVNQ